MEKSQCQRGSRTVNHVVFQVVSGPKTVDIVKDVNIVLVDYLLVNRKVDIIIISLLKIRVSRAETSDVLL